MEDTAARGYLTTDRTSSIPQLVKFEEEMMQTGGKNRVYYFTKSRNRSMSATKNHKRSCEAIPSTLDKAGGTPAPIAPLFFVNFRLNHEGSQKSQ